MGAILILAGMDGASAGAGPVIGISAYEIDVRWSHWPEITSVLVPAAYVHMVRRAGGRPLLLPPPSPHADGDPGAEFADMLDGLVLTGGPDLNPTLYGQERHPETMTIHEERDRGELSLLAAAESRDMPLLGICRGMQLLNVARGGDLHQHIPDVTPDPDAHKALGRFAQHDVLVEPGTLLEGIVGRAAHVHSSHHQAPVAIGRGLTVSARAPDGTVEAVEDRSRRFALGVLWHPEENDPDDIQLFAELVRQAGAYRSARRGGHARAV
jgi:gamma-glutamyl-gamma-aminobutyrate hydrolase PuuD